jgi:arylsulfatase A-like enzyme
MSMGRLAGNIMRNLLASLFFAVLTLPAWAGKQPNIILILADDLGYGDLSCFGQKKLKTPRLDTMAREGMRFTQFYAGCTVCAPSRSVLITGRHMGRTVVRGNSAQPVIVRPGQATLASVLKGTGYKTACIGKWGVGTPDNFTNPNDVGFNHFFGYINMWHAHNFYPEFLIRNGKIVKLKNEVAQKWKSFQDPANPMSGRGVAVKRLEYAPDLFIEDSLDFIRQNHEHPFFLYFAMNVPHANNEAGNKGMEVPDLGEFAKKNWPDPEKGFGAMIRNIDRDTGRILDLLKELKIAENTLVLFTSDNGPHQEGGHKADYFDSNGPYRGIKRDLTEGGIRVPTIAWWPGTIQAGGADGAPWYFGDLMATASELAGAKAPAGIDSESFVDVLHGKKKVRKSPLYWEFYERGSAQAVRFGKWKAIRQPMFTGEVQLYDLSNDPAEVRDQAKEKPQLVKQAASLMEKMHEPDPNWKVRGRRKK